LARGFAAQRNKQLFAECSKSPRAATTKTRSLLAPSFDTLPSKLHVLWLRSLHFAPAAPPPTPVRKHPPCLPASRPSSRPTQRTSRPTGAAHGEGSSSLPATSISCRRQRSTSAGSTRSWLRVFSSKPLRLTVPGCTYGSWLVVHHAGVRRSQELPTAREEPGSPQQFQLSRSPEECGDGALCQE